MLAEQRALVSDLALEHVLQHEPDVGGSLCQTAHEVWIPSLPIWHIDAHVVTVARELHLQVAAHTVEHLKLEGRFRDALALSKINRRIEHLRIVRSDAMIDA